MQVAVSVGKMQLTLYGNYAGFEVVLSVTGMLVDLSVTVMQVTVSVATMQLEISTANMWVAIFTAIMQMRLCCNYTGGIFEVHYA